MSRKDEFIVVSPKNCDSVLRSASPSSAAAKVYRRCSNGKVRSLNVSVKRRGSNKVMHYKVEKIHDPRVVIRDGQEIEYKYRTKVTSQNKKRKSPSRGSRR